MVDVGGKRGQDGALLGLDLDADMFDELLPVDDFFGDYLTGLSASQPDVVLAAAPVQEAHFPRPGFLDAAMADDQGIYAPRESAATGPAPSARPTGRVSAVSNTASEGGNQSPEEGGGKGRRTRGGTTKKGRNERYRTPRQQLLNRQAQQRYRERQKLKNETMEQTIETLMAQVQRLQAVDAENKQLQHHVQALQQQLAMQEAKLKEAMTQKSSRPESPCSTAPLASPAVEDRGEAVDPDLMEAASKLRQAFCSMISKIEGTEAEDVARFCKEVLDMKVTVEQRTGALVMSADSEAGSRADLIPHQLDPHRGVLLPHRESDGRIVMLDKDTKIKFMLKGFESSIKALKAFWDSHNLDDALAKGTRDPEMALRLQEEIAAKVDALLMMNMLVTRAKGPNIASMRRQNGLTIGSLPPCHEVKRRWADVIACLNLTRDQINKILLFRSAHVARLREIYNRRTELNAKVIALLAPHVSAGAGSHAKAFPWYGQPMRDQENGEIDRALTDLKENLVHEQKTASLLEFVMYKKLLTPMQGARVFKEGYPFHNDCLTFCNVVYFIEKEAGWGRELEVMGSDAVKSFCRLMREEVAEAAGVIDTKGDSDASAPSDGSKETVCEKCGCSSTVCDCI